MAEKNRRKSASGDESSSPKRARVEVEECLDPGKKAYREFHRLLRELKSLLSKSGRNEEDISRLQALASKLKELCLRRVGEGETPNPHKVIQIHLKHTLFEMYEKIRDEDNVQNFLTGLEDGSAGKSDRDESVFVFIAKFATELWYQWDNKSQLWQWTPDWKHWMPCSETVVTGGQWKGETPAPENVAIIRYLDAVRPVPSDEPYLHSANVIDLVTKLKGLGDPSIKECLKAVMDSVCGVEVAVNQHVATFKTDLSQLLET